MTCEREGSTCVPPLTPVENRNFSIHVIALLFVPPSVEMTMVAPKIGEGRPVAGAAFTLPSSNVFSAVPYRTVIDAIMR
jgi:hypothetical protein